jgi:hypothetical protein
MLVLEFVMREMDLLVFFWCVLETERKGGERALKEVAKKVNRV